MGDENAIDKVITVCIAAGLGAVMLCSFVIPIFAEMLATLFVGDGGYSEDMAGDIELWKTMLGFVVLIVILGFIIAIVRQTSRDR